MKKIACKVCKSRFPLANDARYTVKEKTSMIPRITKLIECFDCPVCGCQNTVNIRLPRDLSELEEAPGDG